MFKKAFHAVKEAIRDLYEGLAEGELISHGHHKTLEHWFLLLRNIAVGCAVVLFILSIVHIPHSNSYKAAAYFLGALAYFSEILLLTDCFSEKVPHREMFMAYCFGPLYVLLGISYLIGH